MDFSASPENPVLVIGAAGVDMVGRLRSELQMGGSNPSQIRVSFGGVARNVAENLARLGHPVQLITAVGNDANGEALLSHTGAAGVDVAAAVRCEQYPTGAYLATIDARGALQFALDDMRAISALTPELLDQRAELFAGASMLFVDANLSPAALRHALSLARKARLPVCADPTSRALARRLAPHLSRLNLVTPNLTEALELCGLPAVPGTAVPGTDGHETDGAGAALVDAGLATARSLVNHGVSIAIVTLGPGGVAYAASESRGHVPALRTDLVDPTGGGDALTAAVIFALLNGIPLDDAVRLGVSAATLTLRYPDSVAPDLTLEKLYDELVI